MPQVTAKAPRFVKIHASWIDAARGWRYSQAQIPELVAHANPRILLAALSLGSVLSRVRRFPAKSIELPQREKHPSGAKALTSLVGHTARLKSCPFKTHKFTSTQQRRTGGRPFL
jgi:hypothetical protein